MAFFDNGGKKYDAFPSGRIEKKSNSWFRIFKGPTTRTRGFDVMNVFRVGGESRKAFKKRVAFTSGYRKKAPKSKFW